MTDVVSFLSDSLPTILSRISDGSSVMQYEAHIDSANSANATPHVTTSEVVCPLCKTMVTPRRDTPHLLKLEDFTCTDFEPNGFWFRPRSCSDVNRGVNDEWVNYSRVLGQLIAAQTPPAALKSIFKFIVPRSVPCCSCASGRCLGPSEFANGTINYDFVGLTLATQGFFLYNDRHPDFNLTELTGPGYIQTILTTWVATSIEQDANLLQVEC